MHGTFRGCEGLEVVLELGCHSVDMLQDFIWFLSGFTN